MDNVCVVIECINVNNGLIVHQDIEVANDEEGTNGDQVGADGVNDEGGEEGVVEIVCAPDNVAMLKEDIEVADNVLSTPGATNCICIANESYLSVEQIFTAALGRFCSPIHDTFSDFMV